MKTIWTTELLFGVKPEYFDDIEFYLALRERKRLAGVRKSKLANESILNNRDNIYACIEAENWCDRILGEKKLK